MRRFWSAWKSVFRNQRSTGGKSQTLAKGPGGDGNCGAAGDAAPRLSRATYVPLHGSAGVRVTMPGGGAEAAERRAPVSVLADGRRFTVEMALDIIFGRQARTALRRHSALVGADGIGGQRRIP